MANLRAGIVIGSLRLTKAPKLHILCDIKRPALFVFR